MVLGRFFSFGAGYRFLSDSGKFMMGGSLRVPFSGVESRLNMAYLFSQQLDNVFVISINLIGSRREAHPLRGPAPQDRAVLRPRPEPATLPGDRIPASAGTQAAMGSTAQQPAVALPVTNEAAVRPAGSRTTPVRSATNAGSPATNVLRYLKYSGSAQVEAGAPSTVQSGTASSPPEPARLGLAPLETSRISSNQSAGFNALWESSFKATGKFGVKGLQEIRANPAAAGQLTRGCSDAGCLKVLGRILQSGYVAGGRLDKAGNSFFAEFQFLDTQTGEILFSNSSAFDSAGSLEQAIGEFSRECARIAGGR
jgi:hypothetical protein